MNASDFLLIASLALMLGAQAGTADAVEPEAAAPAAEGTASSPSAWTEGIVRTVDRQRGKLTLRHGPLEQFDVPAMTMVLDVADRKMLDSVAPGDRVRFAVERIDGALTVTRLERVAK